MAGVDETLIMLRGGSRDGSSTTVAHGVTRLLTPSDAPGLLDVYEATEQAAHIRGNDDDGVVFEFVGRESAEGVAPEALHMPPGH